MLNGIMSVLVIFMIMAVGAYFTWRKKWPESTNKVFSIAVVQIAARPLPSSASRTTLPRSCCRPHS